MNVAVIPEVKASIERLIDVAQRRSGQSRRVANFLLAWWNAEECGAFDFTDMWGVDRAIAADMVTVFAYVSKCSHYPDTLGFIESAGHRKQYMVFYRREWAAATREEITGIMMKVKRRTVINQHQSSMPEKHVGVARSTIYIGDISIEPYN